MYSGRGATAAGRRSRTAARRSGPPWRRLHVVAAALVVVLAAVGSGVSVGVVAAADPLGTCGVVATPGEYSLSGDVVADRLVCFDVTADNVTISGGGARVVGAGSDVDGSVGIRVAPGVANVTVRDLDATDFEVAISAESATDVTVRNVTLSNNTEGIVLRGGGSHLVRDVTADRNFIGITLDSTRDNDLERITTTNSGRNGIALFRSPFNRFADVETRDNDGNGILARSGSNGNDFDRVTATGNGANGVNVFAGTADNEFTDLVADGNGRAGVSFQLDVSRNRVVNATARENGEWAYYSADDADDNVLTDFDVGTATVSFTGRDVGVRGVGATPTPPAGLQTVDGVVEVDEIPDFFSSSSDAPSYLDVTTGYDDGGVDETTVAFHRYDAENGTWTALPSTVDPAENVVGTETTTFGVLVPLAEAGESSDGVEQVVVTLVETEADLEKLGRDLAIQELQSHAAETQTSLLAYADETEGVTPLRSFWLSNAVLLSVDTTRVSLEEIESIEGVTAVVPNNESFSPPPFEGDAATDPATADTGATGTTYGLEQVNATSVWSTHGVRGDNVTVAVLDTGIDPTHPDLNLHTADPTDATYPGGWAEFNETGGRVVSAPYDAGNNGAAFAHGTHVSGTVAGGNSSGTAIGVAPEARLLHGGVLMQCGSRCGGSTAQVLAGMEWAVEEDADVISMSLGSRWYNPGYVGPVRNARGLGIFVVAAAGNSGPDTGGSPGRVYESFAIGAVNESEGVAYFSSGEVVDTRADWGPFAPEEWPEEYVVPDASGPGVLVVSASPGGTYASANGTSMATPHVAGVAALVISAAGGSGSISPEELERVLEETARKPVVCDPSCTPRDGQDARYGWGIVDAYAAVERVTLSTGVEGTVTDPSGDPIAGATVTADGFSRPTDANGTYRLQLDPGTYTVTVDAPGYAASTRTVTVVATSFTPLDVALAPALDVEVVADAPTLIQARDSADTTLAVRNVENLTVELAPGNTYAERDLTVSVNGRVVAVGETTTFAAPVADDAFVLRADTAAGTRGDLRLVATFGGLGETASVTTTTTRVAPDTVRRVAVVEAFRDDDARNFTAILADELGPDYDVDYVKTFQLPALVERHAYDVYVVQSWREDLTDAEVQWFVDTTAGSDVGVVFLDNYETCSYVNGDTFCSDRSDGIDRISEVTGDPTSVGNQKTHRFSTDAVTYVPLVDHPIFAGLGGVGDNVTLNADIYATSRFNDYDGVVIADVAVVEYTFGGDVEDYQVLGSGAAVNDSRGHVLLAGIGRTDARDERDSYSPFGEWSNESYDVVENAVEYVGPVAPTPDAVVESYALSTTSTRPGEPVTVTATVRNRGSASATVDVTLYADLEQTGQQVTVPAADAETVTFSAVSFAEPGTYYVTVGDDAGVLAPTAVSVADPVNVSVGYTVDPTSVRLNDPVTVTATVTNAGTEPTPVAVALSVDDRATDTRSLTLAPAETRTVAFETRFVEAGAHTVTVNGLPATTVTATDPCFVADAPGTYRLSESILNSPTTSCVRVTSSDVVVDGQGLTVDGVLGPGSVGVLVANVSGSSIYPITNVTVRNLTVTDWVAGVRFDSVTDGRVEDVVSTDVVRGVEFDRSTAATVRDVTVTGAFDGVEVRRTDGVTVENVTVTDGGVGVSLLQGTTDASLVGVTASNNSVGVEAAVDGLAVSDLDVADNSDVGLEVDAASNATVTNVTATGNGNDGVRIGRSSAVTVRNLVATTNGRAGLDVDTSDGATVENVTAEGNGLGVELSRSADLSVVDIVAEGNAGDGLVGRSLSNATVTDVRANANAGRGVSLDIATNSTLSTVTANGNGDHGFLLWRSSGVEGTDLVADGNGGDGLRLWAADGNRFDRSTATNNAGSGIRLETASDNEFRTVDAAGNGGAAFEATDGSVDTLVTDLTVNPTVSFVATDVSVDSVASLPSSPAGLIALGPAVRVASTGSGARIEVVFPYTEGMLADSGVNESTLALYRYDGAVWSTTDSVLVADDDRIEATLSAAAGFGVLAPFGESATPTVTTTTTADGTDVAVQNAVAGDPVEVSLGVEAGDDIRLDAMTVTSNVDADYTLNVSGSDAAPTGQETLAVGTGALTFGYLTVEHSIPDEDVDEVVFRFSIAESALDASGTDPADVTLFRYTNGTWKPVPTTLAATTGTAPNRTFTYEAVSPGLSVFAVGGAGAVSVTDATLDDADVLVGDAVTTTLTLTNAADEPARATLSLTANGTTVASATPVLEAGVTTYQLTYVADDPGRFAVAANGVSAGTVTVRESIPVDALAGGDGPAPVRPESNRVLVLVVYNGSGFDPATLDDGSIRVGDVRAVPGDTVEPERLIRTDVDGDGDVDTTLHVRVGEMPLDDDTTALAVLAETTDGTPVRGDVAVRVVGRGPGRGS